MARNRINSDLALKLYREGKTDKEIAAILGCAYNTVSWWRYRHQLPLNAAPKGNPAFNAVDYDRVRELVEDGKTTKEISSILGVSKAAINTWRRKNGCAAPRGGNQGRPRKKRERKPVEPKENTCLLAVGRTATGRALYMPNNEIRFSFKEAANQQDMLLVLSELNLCPIDEMVDHLETLGFDMKDFRTPSNRPGIDPEKALKLYESGASDQEIADALGVNRSSVRCWRARNGLRSKKERGDAK